MKIAGGEGTARMNRGYYRAFLVLCTLGIILYDQYFSAEVYVDTLFGFVGLPIALCLLALLSFWAFRGLRQPPAASGITTTEVVASVAVLILLGWALLPPPFFGISEPRVLNRDAVRAYETYFGATFPDSVQLLSYQKWRGLDGGNEFLKLAMPAQAYAQFVAASVLATADSSAYPPHNLARYTVDLSGVAGIRRTRLYAPTMLVEEVSLTRDTCELSIMVNPIQPR